LKLPNSCERTLSAQHYGNPATKNFSKGNYILVTMHRAVQFALMAGALLLLFQSAAAAGKRNAACTCGAALLGSLHQPEFESLYSQASACEQPVT
jgi:hypothetical protein